MANLNKCFLIGRVGRDVELRYTPKGTPVAEISIAVTRSWNDDAGQKQEEITWVECLFWSRLAEVAAQFLKKGSPVFVEGRLQTDSWEDKQTGQKRSRLKVVSENLQLLGQKPTAGVSPPLPTSRPAAPASVQPPRPPAPAIDPDLDEPPY